MSEKIRITGHKEVEWEFLRIYTQWKHTPVYAWIRSDGKIIGQPNTNLQQMMLLQEEMKEHTHPGWNIRLIELSYEDTKVILFPPPDSNMPTVGGHALGGPPDIKNISEALEAMKKVFKKNYANFDNTTFKIEDDSAYAECGNVRCWVTQGDFGDNLEGARFRWRAYVSMIKMWNSDYHNVCVGNFSFPEDAIRSALAAFIWYQDQEDYVSYF